MTVIVDAPNCGTASNNHWKVTRLDEPGRIPGLIRFHKRTRMATRLDQVAQWLPEGRWAAGRWRPDPPTVPKWLIAWVEAALQKGVGGMTRPHLDHAEKGDRKWAFAGGCWREWIPCGLGGDWLPSAPPPATARRFNYRAWVLGNVNEIRAAQGRPPVATC